jgi:hypothetical protein
MTAAVIVLIDSVRRWLSKSHDDFVTAKDPAAPSLSSVTR